MNLRVDEGSLKVRVEQDEAKQLFLEGQLRRELAFPSLQGSEEGGLRLLLLCPPESEEKSEVKCPQRDFAHESEVKVAPKGREAGVVLRQHPGQEPGLTLEVSQSLLRGILQQLGILESAGAGASVDFRAQGALPGAVGERPRKSKKLLEIGGNFEIGGARLDLSFEVDCFPPKH